MEKSLNDLSTTVEKTIRPVMSNPYVMAVLKVGLVLYAARIAPAPPALASDLFGNTYFKMLAIFAIAYLSEVDFQLSILLAIVFVLGTNLLSGRKLLESFINDGAPFITDKSKMTDILGAPNKFNTQTLLEGKTDNYPGCNNVTSSDLLDLFGGDSLKMQKTVNYALVELMDRLPAGDARSKLIAVAKLVGIPDNVVVVNDSTAPYIATMLLQYGFIVSDSCSAPGTGVKSDIEPAHESEMALYKNTL
jgi:hypothetical protein